MTKNQFKQGLQAEVKAAGFKNKITATRDLGEMHGYKTVIEFESAIDSKLFDWLDGRFIHGVTRMDDSKWVMVNSPNEGVKYLPGTYVTITKGALTDAVGTVVDKNTVFIIGSGNFRFDHKDYRLSTPAEVMDILLRKSEIESVKVEMGELFIKTKGNYNLRIAGDKITLVCTIPNNEGEIVQTGTNRF